MEVCVKVSVESELEATFGNLWMGKTMLMSGLRIDLNVKENNTKSSFLSAKDDKCGLTPRQIQSMVSDQGFRTGMFDMSDIPPGKGGLKKVTKFTEDTVEKSSVEITGKILGTDITLDISAEKKFSTEVDVECDIDSGTKYLWYSPSPKSTDRSLECFWSVA